MQTWAEPFSDLRSEPELGMEVIVASHLAARFAGRYSMRTFGYVLRTASLLSALGSSVEVLGYGQGLSVHGTSDDKLISGDVLRKLGVKMGNQEDPKASVRLPPHEPSVGIKGAVDEAEAEARAQHVAVQQLA